MVHPRSLTITALSLVPEGRVSELLIKFQAVIAFVGRCHLKGICRWLPQSKFPPSTTQPPTQLPWPSAYFVVDCMTILAPYSTGLQRAGDASVLSTIRGTPHFLGRLGELFYVKNAESGISQRFSEESLCIRSRIFYYFLKRQILIYKLHLYTPSSLR